MLSSCSFAYSLRHGAGNWTDQCGDRTWEDWQRRTGELPQSFPHFPRTVSSRSLSGGSKCRTLGGTSRRDSSAARALAHRLYATSPTNLRSIVTAEKREGNVTIRDVRLEFGPEHRGTLRLQLLIPPHREPLPVFLTNHNRERLGLQRPCTRLYGSHLLCRRPSVWIRR